MKKIASVLTLCLSIGGTSFAATSPLGLPYSNDINTIVTRGELRVAVYASDDLAPFIINNGQQLSGYDINLSRAIAKHLGVTLHIDETSSYNEAVAFVANGQDDIAVTNLTATPDRALSVFFTTPYYKVPLVLIAKSNFDTSNLHVSDNTISFDSSLDIAVEANSALTYYAAIAFPNAKIDTYTDLSQAIRSLNENQYDAVFTDQISAQQAVNGQMLLTIFKLGNAHVDPQAIAVSSKMPQLLQWINNYLTSLQGAAEQASFRKEARLPNS